MIDIESLTFLPKEIGDEAVRLQGTYDFLKLAEKGQNGYLFIAQNRVIDRRVAIKFYYWADGTREHIEPRSLSRVGSSSVIEVLDASLVGDEWAMFVTPFCELGDLDRYLETVRFGQLDAIRFTSLLLEGVAALHALDFVHRDLKPENLLVSDEHKPLIADFGSVRIIPEGEQDVPGSGHAVLYRPPESFTSNRYDRRGDLYQCGIVFYQILGGRLPYSYHEYLTKTERQQYAEMQDDFDRYVLVETAIQRLASKGSLLDLSTLPYFVSTRVKTAIRRATNVNPNQRFQTASDFMNALNTLASKTVDWRFEDDETVAHVDSTIYRVKPKGDSFVTEQNKGKGWRKSSGVNPGTQKQQVRFIEKRSGK